MPPSAVTNLVLDGQLSSKAAIDHSKHPGFRLDRDLHTYFPVIVSGKGNYLFTKEGRAVFDASGGAAVSCLGHGHERVLNALRDHTNTGIPYLSSSFWGSDVVNNLCEELINGTKGEMAKVYLTGSGTSQVYKLSCPTS